MTHQEALHTTAGPSSFRAGFCVARKRRNILLAAILASAIGFIDGTVVSIAMPAIRETLDATLEDAAWISNAYLVTLSALILVGGALGDRFGVGRVFKVGIIAFVATSLLCAVAPTPGTLIAARALQGIGAAIMVPGSLSIISRAYPKDERGRAIGTWAAASALATAAGPIIGGLALSFGGPEMWRWIFAVNLPLGAAAVWLLQRSVVDDPLTRTRSLDWPGAVLATLGLGALAISLTSAEGGETPAFGLAWAAYIGTALLLGFVVQEWRSPHPMMPLRLFADRVFSAANLVTFTLYFGLSAVLFFLPMLVIAGWGVREIDAAAAFVPLTVFITLFSSRFGALADRVGAGPPIALGSATVALAYLWLGFAATWQTFWWGVMPPMLLMGVGMSMVVAPLSAAVMAAASEADSGAASGINNAVSRVSGLVAVAAMSSLVATVYVQAGGSASYGIPDNSPGHVPAMNAAFSAVVWTAAALSAFSAVLAILGLPRRTQTG